MKPLLVLLLMMFGLYSPAVAASDGPSAITPQVSSGRIVTWPGLDGGAAGKMTVWVWLPEAYDAVRGKRFPVLYMHDGQNAFDRRLTQYDKEWGLDEAIGRMAANDDLRDWIVVGVQSPQARYQTLFPEGLYQHLTPAMQSRVTNISVEGIQKGPPLAGDAYLKFLVGTVKKRVDRNFRTLKDPEDTAVMGSSMGGLMALYAMSEYPEVFGQAAAVSIHLPLAGPQDAGVVPEVAAKEVAKAFEDYFATSRMNPNHNHLYMDHGTGTLDGSYAPYFAAFDTMMAKHGWNQWSYSSRSYPGAEHDENAWRARIDIPLAFLDRRDP